MEIYGDIWSHGPNLPWAAHPSRHPAMMIETFGRFAGGLTCTESIRSWGQEAMGSSIGAHQSAFQIQGGLIPSHMKHPPWSQ